MSVPLGVGAWTGGPDAGPSCPLCLRALKGTSLGDHLASAGHSSHDPCCGRCFKHFSTFEALTEHLYGAKASRACGPVFKTSGCRSCLAFFAGPQELREHACPFSHASAAAVPLESAESGLGGSRPAAVALDCEMVDVLCDDGFPRGAAARVCVVDEAERVLLHSLIKPSRQVVDYKFEFTGLKPGDLDDAPDLDTVRARVLAILAGVSDGDAQPPAQLPEPPMPRVLVGHGLVNDLKVLHMSHPVELLRDTALYAPLQRATTKGRAHKLRALVSLHLGYEIQAAGSAHDPEEDAVGAMRLYKRVKCLAECHAVQAKRDEQNLRRARGGTCWAAAARGVKATDGGGDDAPETVAPQAETCWCLDTPAALRTLSPNAR